MNRVILAGLAIVLLRDCELAGPRPSPGKVAGTWGGDNAGLIADDTSAHVHIGCTYGNVHQPIVADAHGRFDLPGEQDITAHPVDRGILHPARFSGSVLGHTMTLTVTLTDTAVTLGPVELTRGGYDPTYERVASAAAMAAALDRHRWDLVIGDHSMPHFSGTAALALVRGRGLDVPFICVSGTISEEMAVAAMRAGANDWVTKGQLKRLIPAIERELRDAKGRAALRASETGYETLVEHAPVGIYRSNPQGRFLTVNAALVRILGYSSAAEVLRLDMARDVYADAAERQRLLDRDSYTDREYDEVEATWKRQDGRLLTVQLSVRAVRNAERQVEYYETFVRDVTE